MSVVPPAVLSTVPTKSQSRTGAGKGSTAAASWNFFKAMFGVGVLTLPHSFQWAGLLGGICIYTLGVALCTYSMVLLVECQTIAQDKADQAAMLSSTEFDTSEHDSVDTSEEPLMRNETEGVSTDSSQLKNLDSTFPARIGETYPALASTIFGRFGYVLVVIVVVTLELAFCIGFVLVMCNNFTVLGGTKEVIAFLLFPVLAVLSCIRWLSSLWILSIIGLFVYLLGVMGVSTFYIVDKKMAYTNPPMLVWNTLPRFLGTALYGLEGIMMALPVRGSMKHPQHAPMVITVSTALYAMFACGFAVLAYTHGLGDGDTITDSLPVGTLSDVVRLSLAITLMLSYPCGLYPVSEAFEEIFGLDAPMKSVQAEHHEEGPATTPSSTSHVDVDVSLEVARNDRTHEDGMPLLAPVADDDSPDTVPLLDDSDAEEGRHSINGSQSVSNAPEGLSNWGVTARRVALRASLVLFTCIVAAVVEDLSVFSSVVGMIFVPLAGFFLPPLLHWKLCPNMTWQKRVLDCIMLGTGCVVLVIGLFTLWEGPA